MKCKYLSGDGLQWFQCQKTKRRCGYQRFCSGKGRFVVDCEKCPLCKDKKAEQKQSN